MPTEDISTTQPPGLSKHQGREARRRVEVYHRQKLAELMEDVRRALDTFENGYIDAFELDYVIQTYCKQSKELFNFINTYYPSNAKLPTLLVWIDDEARGQRPWKLKTVLAEEIRVKLTRQS